MSLGKADLSRTEWERRLIQRLRVLHFSWRTEETYRGWASDRGLGILPKGHGRDARATNLTWLHRLARGVLLADVR